MKTIHQIYGDYMNERLAKSILECAEHCITMLILRRNELVEKDLHDDRVSDTVDALNHWINIQEQYKKYLDKGKQDE